MPIWADPGKPGANDDLFDLKSVSIPTIDEKMMWNLLYPAYEAARNIEISNRNKVC
jgi:hypothetical protein